MATNPMRIVAHVASKLRRQGVIATLFQVAARLRLEGITRDVVQRYSLAVRSGPFRGMVLPAHNNQGWGSGSLLACILGCFEEELHTSVLKAVGREPTRVVNVGCSGGYYAVGFARLLPHAEVFAYDIDPSAQAICRVAASANGVGDRVRIAGECSSAILRDLAAQPGRTLVVMDCEGAEAHLLDNPTVAALANVDLIVECHDFVIPGITDTLSDRLARGHMVERFVETARDPYRYPEIAELQGLEKMLGVWEVRTEKTTWLAAWSNIKG
jgi:predicted O-methyltransferase YrrM